MQTTGAEAYGSRRVPRRSRPAAGRPVIGAGLWLLLATVGGQCLAQDADEALALPPATAETPLELPTRGLVDQIKYRALVRPDPDGTLGPEALLTSDAGFTPFDPRLDEATPPLWLKFHVRAHPDSGGRLVLRVDRRYFPILEAYVPRANGDYQHIHASVGAAHDAQSVGRELVFPVEIAPGQSRPVLLHVQTLQDSLRPLKLALQDADSFADNRALTYMAYGLYFGVLLALIFHNLILYLNLRQRGHLLYVLAMVSVTGMMALDSGLIESHLLSADQQTLGFRLNVVFVILAYAFIGRFFQVFVQSERYVPRLHQVITVAFYGLLAMAGILVVLPVPIALPSLMVAQPILVFVMVLLLVASLLSAIRGSTEGKIFCIAWSFVFLASFIRLFLSFDLIDNNLFLEHTLYLGSVLEASILALGLSYRVRQLYERHSEALREQHKAARLANLDPLTNAYNRRFLENYLGNMLRDTGKGPFGGAVLILDLDDFKTANDEYGHAAGDAILRDLVQRCQQVMRESDVLCRLGGDEFVIVANDLGDRSAEDVGNRVARAIAEEPFIFENRQIAVTTSIGFVTSIPAGKTVSQVLRMADQGLYRAKQAGRNRVVRHDADDTTPFRHGRSLKRTGRQQA